MKRDTSMWSEIWATRPPWYVLVGAAVLFSGALYALSRCLTGLVAEIVAVS